jgi:hypothetical protein
MNEINYIINFVNKYYNNFIYESIDTMDEKINKSIMFLIYLSIIFIVLGSNLRTMPIALIILLIFVKHTYIKEQFDPEKKCRLPTIDNPFMNPLFEVDNLEACNATEKEILAKYYHNLPRNMDDVFDRKTGQLYYKINNVTSIPNNYKDFIKFIGSTKDQPDNNCKYDGVNCLKYDDLRYH